MDAVARKVAAVVEPCLNGRMSVVLIPDSILHCATNTPRGTTGRKVRRDRLRRCDAVSCPGSTAPHRSEPLRGARACRRERLRERGTRTTPTVSCSATSALVANIAASPYRDAVCAAAAAAGSYAWVKFFDFLASKNVLEKARCCCYINSHTYCPCFPRDQDRTLAKGDKTVPLFRSLLALLMHVLDFLWHYSDAFCLTSRP